MKNWKEKFDKKFNIFGECNPPHCHNMRWGGKYIELEAFIEQTLKERDKEIIENIKGRMKCWKSDDEYTGGYYNYSAQEIINFIKKK